MAAKSPATRSSSARSAPRSSGSAPSDAGSGGGPPLGGSSGGRSRASTARPSRRVRTSSVDRAAAVASAAPTDGLGEPGRSAKPSPIVTGLKGLGRGIRRLWLLVARWCGQLARAVGAGASATRSIDSGPQAGRAGPGPAGRGPDLRGRHLARCGRPDRRAGRRRRPGVVRAAGLRLPGGAGRGRHRADAGRTGPGAPAPADRRRGRGRAQRGRRPARRCTSPVCPTARSTPPASGWRPAARSAGWPGSRCTSGITAVPAILLLVLLGLFGLLLVLGISVADVPRLIRGGWRELGGHRRTTTSRTETARIRGDGDDHPLDPDVRAAAPRLRRPSRRRQAVDADAEDADADVCRRDHRWPTPAHPADPGSPRNRGRGPGAARPTPATAGRRRPRPSPRPPPSSCPVVTPDASAGYQLPPPTLLKLGAPPKVSLVRERRHDRPDHRRPGAVQHRRRGHRVHPGPDRHPVRGGTRARASRSRRSPP